MTLHFCLSGAHLQNKMTALENGELISAYSFNFPPPPPAASISSKLSCSINQTSITSEWFNSSQSLMNLKDCSGLIVRRFLWCMNGRDYEVGMEMGWVRPKQEEEIVQLRLKFRFAWIFCCNSHVHRLLVMMISSALSFSEANMTDVSWLLNLWKNIADVVGDYVAQHYVASCTVCDSAVMAILLALVCRTETMRQLLCLKSKFSNHFAFTLGRYLFLLFWV